MDWRWAMEEERAALQRVVALILALAGLAELAHGRSRAACIAVFWILQPAERVIHDLLDSSSGEFPGDEFPKDAVRSGDIRVDTIRLALRLRHLARLLECQLELVFAGNGGDAGVFEAVLSIGRGLNKITSAFRISPPVIFIDSS